MLTGAVCQHAEIISFSVLARCSCEHASIVANQKPSFTAVVHPGDSSAPARSISLPAHTHIIERIHLKFNVYHIEMRVVPEAARQHAEIHWKDTLK
jgi:hypothetical protein